jgi:hypothetical protein
MMQHSRKTEILFNFCPALILLFENFPLISILFFYTATSADGLAQTGSYLPTLGEIISGILCI